MNNTSRTMNGQDWSLLIFLSMLWGGAYFFAGFAVREVPPLTVVLARVALAALTLLPLLWMMGHRLPRTAADWLPFADMGLLNNVLPFGFIFSGQLFITVGMPSIINAMTPLFTMMIMAAFREEQLTATRLVGVLLGLAGVAILRGFEGPMGGPETIGILLCMTGAVSYGFAALWGRRRLTGVPPLKSACCQLLASTAIIGVVVALVDQPWTLPMPSAPTLGALAGLAIFGTALANLVFFKILVRAGATNVMLVTLLIPITAIALGNVFLGEPVRAQEIVGAGVIGLGLAFIDGRLVRWARREAG